jgi:hypothetical protein
MAWSPPSAEWTGLIKCRGGTSPASEMDRRRALSAINAEAAWPRGLTSGSARWLTSQAVGHVVRARGGLGPYPEVRSVYAGVWHLPMGVRTHC